MVHKPLMKHAVFFLERGGTVVGWGGEVMLGRGQVKKVTLPAPWVVEIP